MRWLLIDKILECKPGVSAEGVKTFSRSESFFMDHFPGMPIVPGVLQIEMMAQMAGKCIAIQNPGILPVLGTVKAAKFYKNINPGDRCHIKVQITKSAKNYSMAEGHVEVDGVKVSSASILFGHVQRSVLTSQDFDAVVSDWKNREQMKAQNEAAQ
ncbi:MAG: 3-hydroxyacyl-ACP dehydratase FabZ family protein [Pseudobdellovibrionaceae bacterium]